MEFSDRLKRERARIGMTQDQLASACGVSKRAQANYESGERFPDARYLAAAEEAGVDLQFLVSGRKTEHVRQMGNAILRVFECIERRIPALGAWTMLGIIQIIAQDEANAKDDDWKGGFVADEQRQRLIDAVLDHDPLMGDLLFAIGNEAKQQNASLSPEKFIRLALRLLPAFTESGEVDRAKVAEAVSFSAD